jgi:hypothetical protein
MLLQRLMRRRGEGLDRETTGIALWRREIGRGMRGYWRWPKSRVVGTAGGSKWISKGIAPRGRMMWRWCWGWARRRIPWWEMWRRAKGIGKWLRRCLS